MATRRSYPSKPSSNSNLKSKSSPNPNAILPFNILDPIKATFRFIFRVFKAVSDELWAIFLAIGALLVLLSLVSNSIGAAGNLIRRYFGDLFGVGRFGVVVIFVFVALKLYAAGINQAERSAKVEFKTSSVRTSIIGSLLILIIFSSMVDIGSGSYSVHVSDTKLYSAGGFVGSLIGTTLSSIFGSVGGFLILIAVMLACIVVVFSITFSNINQAYRAIQNSRRQTQQKRIDLEAKTQQRLKDNQSEKSYDKKSGLTESDTTFGSKKVESSEVTKYESTTEAYLGEPEYGDVGSEDSTDLATGTPVDFKTGQSPPIKLSDVNSDGTQHDFAVSTNKTQLSFQFPDSSKTKWDKPPLSLLSSSSSHKVDDSIIKDAGEILVNALASHGVDTSLSNYTVGPTVTRYELELAPGVKVAKVTSLSKDIAYAMASPDVRILAPIPGKSAIGIEVPNRVRQLVTLGDLLVTNEFKKSVHPLEVALGRNISGKTVVVNLAEMPHILIAGATGAGKSSCINSLITSLLMKATPEELRLILIDPKRVELGQYNGLPHLLTEVVVNPKLAANKLRWAVEEMERRYDILASYGFRDITGYHLALSKGELPIIQPPNSLEQTSASDIPESSSDDLKPTKEQAERLPFILVVVDELNDLMMVASHEVEDSICRIAQMARAVGIHLVIATQRPSVDVITGVIKANIPSRLAFSVSSIADSRVILDQAGAERLIGRGDMLLLTSNSSNPTRLQGPWVSEKEVHSVVHFWKKQSSPAYLDELEDISDASENGLITDGQEDDLLSAAIELVVKSGLGSTSMLTRKLKIGYPRAGRLMDMMEERGIVGPADGSKPRQVYKSTDDLNELKSM